MHEVSFFCNTELPNSKYSIHLYKAHYMDMLMEQQPESICGRALRKGSEPLDAPQETPLIQEMRQMHVDFVEEAYWKRVSAC